VTPAARRARDAGLVVIYAFLPLYGTFAALDPERPPIPPLVPNAVTVALIFVVLAGYLLTMPAALGRIRADSVTFAYLAAGFGTILAGLCGFDPVTGVGLGVVFLGVGLSGLALDGADASAVRLATRTFLWSALLACGLALALWLAHHPAALYAYNNGRAVGTFLNPNELAAYALVALGVAVPPAVLSRGRDLLATAAAVLLIAALTATFSRWGLLSAVAGIAAFALMRRARGLFIACIVVAAAGLAVNALAGGAHHSPRDDAARIVAWRAGVTTVVQFPLLGVGPLAYGRVYSEMRPPDAPGPRTAVAFDPHSLPLSYAAGGGLVSLAIFVAIIVVLQRRVLRAAGRTRVAALGISAGLIALYVDCAVNTISIFLPLLFQGAALAYATARNDERG
jgi:O-antigen ligase